MILMPVIAIVCENNIRRELGLDLLKSLLDCLALIREEAGTEFLQLDSRFRPFARNSRALRLASIFLGGWALKTTHRTSTAGFSSIRESRVPPQPISISSE